MSIWSYESGGDIPDAGQCYGDICRFCGSHLIWQSVPDHWPICESQVREHHKIEVRRLICAAGYRWFKRNLEITGQIQLDVSLGQCAVCGWWVLVKAHNFNSVDNYWGQYYGSCGELLNFDLNDIQSPIHDVRDYLSMKYEARFSVNPRLMEETVASVFRDFGYKAQVTEPTNDGGIDIILIDNEGKFIGVQFKRTKNSIKVEQIRSLIGALVVGDYTKGLYITTSNFQSGCGKISGTKFSMDMMDGDRFLSCLRVAQVSNFARYQNKIIENLILNKIDLEYAFEYHLNSL